MKNIIEDQLIKGLEILSSFSGNCFLHLKKDEKYNRRIAYKRFGNIEQFQWKLFFASKKGRVHLYSLPLL
jgi:hypothetical protein